MERRCLQEARVGTKVRSTHCKTGFLKVSEAMRSQKVSNRAPRPFKTKTDRWSGVRVPKVLFTAPKPATPAVNADAAAEKPADKTTDKE